MLGVICVAISALLTLFSPSPFAGIVGISGLVKVANVCGIDSFPMDMWIDIAIFLMTAGMLLICQIDDGEK